MENIRQIALAPGLVVFSLILLTLSFFITELLAQFQKKVAKMVSLPPPSWNETRKRENTFNQLISIAIAGSCLIRYSHSLVSSCFKWSSTW